MDSQKIGQYIAYKRKEKGLTQKQLAEALLITNKAVSKWETGTSMPDISLLKELAQILEVTVDELLNGEDSVEKKEAPIHHYQTMTITQHLYKTYLQQMFYHHYAILIISVLAGCLLMCGGFAVYLLNRYIQHHFDVLGLVMIVIGIICLLSIRVKLLLQIHFYKPQDIQYQLNQQSFDYIQDGKKISYFYQDIQDIWDFDNFVVCKIQNKDFYFQKEDLKYILQRNSTLIHHPIKRKEKIILAIKIISLLIFVLLSCLELGYIVILKRLGFEYFFDALEWLVLVGAILSLYVFVSINRKPWNRQSFMILGLSMIIILIVIWITGNSFSSYYTYYSISPDLSSQLVLKQNKTTGQMKDLHYTFLCFGKAHGIYDTDGQNISTLWINGDNNLVNYYDHNHQQQVFVATYGDRGNGISYYYVTSTLSGDWITKDDKDQNYKVSVDKGTIEIQNEGETTIYDYSQIEQFGTTAIICKNHYGIARYVIALNKNCKLNHDDGLVASGGTVTIIDMKNLIPVELFCTTYKEDPVVQQQIDDDMEQRAQQQITEMNTLLKQDASLKTFQNSDGLFKIETQSQDFFEITRLAYQADIGTTSHSVYQLIDQMNTIIVRAGTIDDFYVEVEADTWMENVSTGEIIEGGYIPKYRIMRGDGCYLVRKMSYRVPGDINLIALSSPLEKDVSQNQLYRFERQ